MRQRAIKLVTAPIKSNQWKYYYCSVCSRKFPSSQALGGHFSKNHHFESKSYAKQILKKKEKKLRNEILRITKLVYDTKYERK